LFDVVARGADRRRLIKRYFTLPKDKRRVCTTRPTNGEVHGHVNRSLDHSSGVICAILTHTLNCRCDSLIFHSSSGIGRTLCTVARDFRGLGHRSMQLSLSHTCMSHSAQLIWQSLQTVCRTWCTVVVGQSCWSIWHTGRPPYGIAHKCSRLLLLV